MTKILPALLLGLAVPAHALWPFSDPKPSGPLGAVLAEVSGPVTVQKAGTAAAVPGASQTALDTGDLVRTGAGASAVIAFLDGSKMRVKENSAFGVGAHSAKKVGVSIDVGTLQFWITKQAKKRRYTMRTPTAVASVRGTTGEVEVALNGETSFSLFTGGLLIEDNRGNSVRLDPQQAVKADDQTGLENAKVEALPPNKQPEPEPQVTPLPQPSPEPGPTPEPEPGQEPAQEPQGSTSPTQDIQSPVSGSTP